MILSHVDTPNLRHDLQSRHVSLEFTLGNFVGLEHNTRAGVHTIAKHTLHLVSASV